MQRKSPRLRVQIRSTINRGKLTGYECYDVETRKTLSAHPVDELHPRQIALAAARIKCKEFNSEP
jgi:hypothetical protein